MRPELEYIEKIERYLLGELDKEEMLQFEQQLKTDSHLAEQVAMQRLLMKAVENAGLRKTLNHIHSSSYDNPYARRMQVWGKYIAGGAFVLLLIAGLLLWNKNDNAVDPVRADREFRRDSLSHEIEKAMNEKDTAVYSETEESVKELPVFFDHQNPLDNFFSNSRVPSAYFFIDPYRDTVITGSRGTSINIASGTFAYENGMPVSSLFTFELKEVYNKSEIILNDLVNKSTGNTESSGGIYIDAADKNKQLRLIQGKTLKVDFYERVPHVNNPHQESDPAPEDKEFVYYKVFDDKPESRIIILPAVVLDYDIIYTRKSADPLMNERIESLLLPEYENTFTSTTQFHYRIEGCQLYGKGVELLDIYLNNTHLKLWQADSLIVEYFNLKAQEDCANQDKHRKAAEYFRWLKSMKQGRVERIKALDYRNYRKGQLYNKLPDKSLEKYLGENGLTHQESLELIWYFKKMFHFRKMFYKKTQYAQLTGENASLDYYYENEDRFIAYEKQDCSGKNNEKKKNYVYKTGDRLGAATELNHFMPVNRLGWINSERFVNYKNTATLKVILSGTDTSFYSKVYIVFKDVSAVLGGKWSKEGVNVFERVPKGTKVYLVALCYTHNKLYYGRKEIISGKEEEVVEVQPAQEAFIRKDLLQLDQ